MTNIGTETLKTNAKKLFEKPKGILAADESAKTCCARFEKVNLECTPETRREYREILFGTQGIGQYVSGVILTDETIRQKASDGISFVELLAREGVQSGIKVDAGLVPIESGEEEETIGLDGLPERLMEYKSLGATFAKWRAVFNVGSGLPSEDVLLHNVVSLAKYAKECQEAGIVPIVEPEVIMEGSHSAEEASVTISRVLKALFEELARERVDLEGLVLKTAMAVSGKDSSGRATAAAVARQTIDALKISVPENIAGVVYLSGGQGEDEARENFCEIMKLASEVPFPMTFSFSRAIQNSVLAEWAKNKNPETSRQIFLQNLASLSACIK